MKGPSWMLAAMLLGAGPVVWADGIGAAVTLSSDRVERGVSQSGGQTSVAGDIEWSHRLGGYLGLGVSSVDSEQFGGARAQWSPRAGWRGSFGPDAAGHWGAGLAAHVFPGASGRRATALPPRGTATTQARQTDFTTAAVNLSLGWQDLTLDLDRSLTDYYGVGEDLVQSNAAGQRLVTRGADSVGSWHVGLNYRHGFNDVFTVWVGIGRQVIRNFDALNYTDWSLGASLRALGLSWSLEATGTTARDDYWRVERGAGGTRALTGKRLSGSVAWAF